jgi:hypothetical protein
MLKYNYIADFVTSHGEATKKMLTDVGVPADIVFPIGNNFGVQDGQHIDPLEVRITIATRSWGGLWSNYSSRHNKYDAELRSFLRLAEQRNWFVTIKSHPNGDYHEYYDLLAKRYKNVSHISKGWKPDEFRKKTDILVCFGEMPSLFIEALYMQIPIIFVDGVMTITQKKLNYNYSGLGAIVSTGTDAVMKIQNLIDNKKIVEDILAKQSAVVMEYQTKGLPEENLTRLIKSKIN